MKARHLLFWTMFSAAGLFAQQPGEPSTEARVIDSLYREDQIYLGFSYNILLNRPPGVSQNNLSYGLQIGVIRDMPVNRSRTVALGIGLGYALHSYYSNLRAIQSGSDIQYIIPAGGVSYKRNKLETHLVEVPIEFRWRNSTPTDFSFWRIYGGVKFAYIVGARSKYVTAEFKDTFYNTDAAKFQYGLTLSLGYNALNFHMYYGLNSLFKDGTNGPEGVPLEMTPLRIGLIYYIL